MDKKPPLSRQKSVFLDFLDECKEEEVYRPQANDMIEYDCPSCYIPFNTDIELSEHIILSNCFLEKLESQKDSHRLEIESLKHEHKTEIISYLIRIKYLEDQLEWFTIIFQKIREFLQSL